MGRWIKGVKRFGGVGWKNNLKKKKKYIIKGRNFMAGQTTLWAPNVN